MILQLIKSQDDSFGEQESYIESELSGRVLDYESRFQQLQNKYNQMKVSQFKQRQNQVVINDKGRQVILPSLRKMDSIYELLPTKLNKNLDPHFEETRQACQDTLLEQEQEYIEFMLKYQDTQQKSDQELPTYFSHQFDFTPDHLLPKINLPIVQKVEFLSLNFIAVDIPEINEVYPNAPRLLQELNSALGNKRWPFITCENTFASYFMKHITQKEKVRPLHPRFKNDFYLEFEDLPSHSEITKRAQILAKIYCKNTLSDEQKRLREKMDEYGILLREREEVDLAMVQQMLPLDPQIMRKDNIIRNNGEANKMDTTIRPKYAQELLHRTQQVYREVNEWLEDRAYDFYLKGRFKESLEYKRKKEEVEIDMKTISDPEQLLKILLLFKMTYKI